MRVCLPLLLLHQVLRSLALAKTEPHPQEEAPLGQMLGAHLQLGLGPSTLPRHPRPQGVPGLWAGPLPLEASRGAFRSLEGQALNCPLAMALLKIKQCWISLRR